MAAVDPRIVVGAQVTTKASMVTCMSECARQYGSNTNMKMPIGTIENTTQERTPTGRRRTFVIANFNLSGGVTKKATVNIRSVKLVPPPPPPSSSSSCYAYCDSAASGCPAARTLARRRSRAGSYKRKRFSR